MREEITAYKRERILEEAVKLFYQRGFSGTTLDDIAGKLGVTKPFIYTHFRSKVELLEAICRPTIEMSLEAIARTAGQPGTPSERLFVGIVDFSKVVLQRQANIAVYFREEKHLSEAGLAEINALRKRFDRVLSELLEEGVRAGEFQIADVRVAALAIGGMVSWAYTWYQPEGRLPIDEVGAKLARFALQMVGVRPVFTPL
jgi:AcrR family transcriptional regulator